MLKRINLFILLVSVSSTANACFYSPPSLIKQDKETALYFILVSSLVFLFSTLIRFSNKNKGFSTFAVSHLIALLLSVSVFFIDPLRLSGSCGMPLFVLMAQCLLGILIVLLVVELSQYCSFRKNQTAK